MALELFTRKLGEGGRRAAAASIETTHQRGCGVAFLRDLILSPGTMVPASLLNGLQPIRLCRPRVRAITAGFGLERIATAFMNNPG